MLLKVLVGAACVVVIAAGVYFLVGEIQNRQEARLAADTAEATRAEAQCSQYAAEMERANAGNPQPLDRSQNVLDMLLSTCPGGRAYVAP